MTMNADRFCTKPTLPVVIWASKLHELDPNLKKFIIISKSSIRNQGIQIQRLLIEMLLSRFYPAMYS
jgi:hypothetical protein